MQYPAVGTGNNPFRMLQDKDGHYWLATWGDGLYLFNPEEERDKMYRRLKVENHDKLKTEENIFFSLAQDNVHGYIWTLGYGELHALELSGEGKLRQVDVRSVIDYSKMFSCMYKDSAGNLWIGSFDVGYNLFFEEANIKNYRLSSIKRETGHDANLLCLYPDADGYFWISQERHSLCLFNSKTGTLTYSPSVEVGVITGSAEKGCVWISLKFNPAIFKMKREGEKTVIAEELNLDKTLPNPGIITDIQEDNAGNLWIQTTWHLFVKPKGKDVILQDTGIPYTANFTPDKEGFIWVGSKEGTIYRLRYDDGIKTDRMLQLTSIDKTERIVSIYADTDNNLWCATSQGRLLVSDQAKRTLTDKTEACGMNGEAIMNILGNREYLWIVTNQSITRHNLINGNNEKLFASDENISVTAFRQKAAFCDGNSIYVGGHGGFISIGPDKGDKNREHLYPVQITDVRANNRSLLFEADSCGQTGSMHQCTFNPEDENIEIQFSSLKYTGSKKIKYAYRMQGVDKDWIHIDDGKHSAFYNKLGKGEYTFQVKATDGKGNWNEAVTSMTIIKLPAYYETWYAYLLYILLASTTIYLLLRSYISRIKLKNSLTLNEELTQTKLRYFTNVSHELLTPLTVISCATDELEMNSSATARQVKTLRSNVDRLKKLLHQVLDFRKVENGKMVLKVSKGNVSDFISHIGNTNFLPLAQNKNIDFTLEIEEKNLWGYLDFDKLDQILFNLLSNAVKYTPEGKRITLWAGREEKENGSYLCIKVADEGIGIPTKEQENIFTRFYSSKQHTGESNGIGLSLTRDLLTLHHGSIQVESKVGKGSCFIVTLPIDKESYSFEELMYTEPISIEEEQQPEAEDAEKLCILVVDDNPELLGLMRNILAAKYRVLTAENGKGALAIVREQTVGVIVCDVMMPEMDGLTCCRLLKEDIGTSHIPVIMLTAKDTAEDRVAAYKAGANAFIAKPFEMKVLQARIDNLVDSSESKKKEFRMSKEMNLSRFEFQSSDEAFLKKAIQYIERDMDNPELDVNTFAGELNVSKSTLNRKIKAMTGLSSLDFIKNIRLKYACTMLQKKGVSISEVAYQVGFSNPKYFTKCFKEEFGMTPTEFQSRQEEEKKE